MGRTSEPWLFETGEMAGRIREFDWEGTPLGPLASWPDRLRALIELVLASPQPMHLAWGPELTVLYGDAAIPIYGHRHPGALGKPWHAVWPEVSDAQQPMIDALLRGEPQYVVDAPLSLTGDSEHPIRWFTSASTPVRDDIGQVGGILTVTTETTAAVLARRKLEASEDELRVVMDTVPAMMGYVDRAQRFRLVNEAFCRYYRLPREQVIGRSVKEVVGPAVYGRLRAGIEAALRGEGVCFDDVDPDLHGAGLDGVSVEHYLPRFGPDGAVERIYFLSFGITAQRQAEAALRASETRYQAVVDAQSELISRWLPGTATITFVNEANCRAIGRSREEIVGRSILDFVLPENRERLAAYFASLSANPRIAAEEHEAVLADGSIRWFHWVDTPVFDASGELVEFQGVGRDVTVLRQTEEALRALSRRLLVVQEEERRAVARELHEDVGQILTGLTLQLAMPDETGARADAVIGLTKDLIARVRRLATGLRPPELDDFGLVAALEGYSERLTRETGIALELRHEGCDRRFPVAVEIAAYRIAEEALANVTCHAAVNRATVSLSTDSSVLTLAIQDEGRGFDPGAVVSGNGLAGMRERALLLGGTLTIDAAPGAGVTVAATLPLAEST
jgi:PAS domain S-box-containing protein